MKRWTIYEIREASPEELEAAFGEPSCEVVRASGPTEDEIRIHNARDAFIEAAADYLVNRPVDCEWAREDAVKKLDALRAALDSTAD